MKWLLAAIVLLTITAGVLSWNLWDMHANLRDMRIKLQAQQTAISEAQAHDKDCRDRFAYLASKYESLVKATAECRYE